MPTLRNTTRRCYYVNVRYPYPSVYRAHVVPKAYLRNFAADEKIAVRKGGVTASVEVKSVEKAGTRARFYRRTRPKSGDEIHDIEWSLSHIEDKAAPILREINDSWPLDPARKAVIAEFFGYQLVRGPRWMDWHRRYVDDLLETYRRVASPSDDDFAKAKEQYESDSYRMTKMLDLGIRVASILGCMRWSLVEFSSPLIATSDHPVDVWQASATTRVAVGSANEGVRDALEVRVPLTPTSVLLMTWIDERDGTTARLVGDAQQAGTLNAFAVANADRQWFHLPGTNPPVASGQLTPLAPQLMPGYAASTIAASQRHAQLTAWLHSTSGEMLKMRDKLIIT